MKLFIEYLAVELRAWLTLENFFGSLTLLLASAMAVIALPMQALKTYKTRETVSLWLASLALGVYLSRAAYSWIIGSYFILIPDVLGATFSLVILAQCAGYMQ